MGWLTTVYDTIAAELSDEALWRNVTWSVIRILFILLAGRILILVLNRFIDHLVSNKELRRLSHQTRRIRTIAKLLKNVGSYTIHFVSVLLILSEFNINLGPLLAGAGVIGLAIGFGAQSLVKDVIAGFFIVVEDQFAVGDVIQTGTMKGTVELVGMRSTRIQSWTGEVHIIPNGMINQVTNYSIHNTLAVVDISVPLQANTEETLAMMNDIVMKIEDSNIIKPPQVLGIQSMTASEMSIRVIAECKPNTHGSVSRVLNREIKLGIDQRRSDSQRL